MKILILPEAESDLARAADFYDAQRTARVITSSHASLPSSRP
jgi:hypothetical protein